MKKLKITLFLLSISLAVVAQEGFPIYSDYLSDNVFLLHPSMAGVGNYAKLRMTHRRQWAGVPNAPALQSLSFHVRLWKTTGLGVILYTDNNGYHSEKGAQLAYAYHLNLASNSSKLNQLSFGLNGNIIRNELNEQNFKESDFDPIISGVLHGKGYFNADMGVSYHYTDFYAHLTVKNLFFSSRSVDSNVFESVNLKRYILSAGYFLGSDTPLQWEPSFMVQLVDYSGEKTVDINIKTYLERGAYQIWGGLSYRRSFEGNKVQELQYISPIAGLNYKSMMISYTYSHQTGALKFQNGGFHQITLGLNLFYRDKIKKCGCPQINR